VILDRSMVELRFQLLLVLGSIFKSRARLEAEILVLRQQMDAIPAAWLRANVFQPWEGGPCLVVMYLATVDWATSIPSISSSPWIRGAPHSEFSLLIRRMRSRISRSILGAATTSAGFPAPIGPKAAPMPADHGFGLDHGDRIQNRGEESVQPDEDQPIDVPRPHPRPGLAA
jgi:hypothetical protein